MHDPLIAVVHLVTQDEYLSSKKCRKCKGWLTQVSPREKKCNSSDCSGTVVNRDDNAQVCALRPPPPPPWTLFTSPYHAPAAHAVPLSPVPHTAQANLQLCVEMWLDGQDRPSYLERPPSKPKA